MVNLKKSMVFWTLLGCLFLLFACENSADNSTGNGDDSTKESVVSVTGLALSSSKIELSPGESHIFYSVVEPQNATNRNVLWSVVPKSSYITLVDNHNGTASITISRNAAAVADFSIVASTADGGKTAYCQVSVKDVASPDPNPNPEDKKGIGLDKTFLTLDVGGVGDVHATLYESGDSISSWYVDSSCVDISYSDNDKTFCVVHGVAEGEETITAYTNNGYNATCHVTVNAVEIPDPNPTPDEGNSYKIPEGCTRIDEATIDATYASQYDTIVIPSSVMEIADGAFRKCVNLRRIIVDTGNDYFSTKDDVLFSKSKEKLICYPAGRQDSTYDVPDGVAEMCGYAFSGCKYLERLYVPDSVTHTGEGAFYGCRSLDEVSIPNVELHSVMIEGENIEYGFILNLADKDEMSQVLSEGDDNAAEKFLEGLISPKKVVVRKGDIPEVAFGFCYNITDVTIPSDATSIGQAAFICCMSLKSITIPSSVKRIESQAFEDCRSLESVLFKESYGWQHDSGGGEFDSIFTDSQSAAEYLKAQDTGCFTFIRN